VTESILDWLANLPFVIVLAVAVVLYAMDTFVKRSPLLKGAFHRAADEVVESLLFAWVVVFLILKPFFLQAFFIPSESMVPTLLTHDRLLVSKVPFWWRGPQRGEILVFKAPQNADKDGIQRDFIKRCIGLPGETLEVRNHQIFINGTRLEEQYTQEVTSADGREGDPDFGPIVVPPGHYFMMGDNRNNSADSRYWGPLDASRVVGKAWIRFWPLDTIGFLSPPRYNVPQKPQPAIGLREIVR
jgi:signal peptidase I